MGAQPVAVSLFRFPLSLVSVYNSPVSDDPALAGAAVSVEEDCATAAAANA